MAEKAGGTTLISRVVRDLSKLSLEYEEGARLGAEDELLIRLGVSRPTLRQAAKIAESEHMISVRRGTRGGFYAARPDVDDSIRGLNRYLRLQGVTLREISVINTISEEAAALAANCEDDSRRAALASLLGEVPKLGTSREFVEFDARFVRLLSEMSGNPVVEVLIAMSYSFGLDEQGIHLYVDDAQRDAARRFFTEIGEAVLQRDSEMARFMMRRRLSTILKWINAADSSQFGLTGRSQS